MAYQDRAKARIQRRSTRRLGRALEKIKKSEKSKGGYGSYKTVTTSKKQTARVKKILAKASKQYEKINTKIKSRRVKDLGKR